jgi:hypothetical protein
MTETEARKIIQRIQVLAQKAKSNLIESMGDPEMDDPMLWVVKDLYPELFATKEDGAVNIIELANMLLNKEGLVPEDLRHLMFFVNRSTVMSIMNVSYYKWEPLPTFEELMQNAAGWETGENKR